MSIRVLVADDMLIAREGLKKILETDVEIEVVGEVSTAQSLKRKILELDPDILLVDLMWYGDLTAGVAAIQQIKEVSPQTKIIAISNYLNLIPEARNAGAEVAIEKGFSMSELIDTIKEIYALESFPSPTQRDSIINVLTDREKEVLSFLAEGLTAREVARRIGVTESTVKNHVAHILGKLDARNTTEAVVLAYKSGILKY